MSCETLSAQSTTQPRLSKSRIAAFQHCSRRLWLQIHRPDLARFDAATLALFACGHQVGAVARWRYPAGVLVGEDHRDLVAALAHTRLLLEAPVQIPIFEAAFERNGVVIRADVLEPDGWGGWKLIEVKNSGRLKSYQIHDVATQAWVLRGNRVCISAVIIRHVDRAVRATTLIRSRINFVDADVTADAFDLTKRREAVVAAARAAARGPEPAIAPGSHCNRPACEFRDHCWNAGAIAVDDRGVQ